MGLFLLWRTWASFTALIAMVLVVLATLSILQHNAVLSDLIKQRISVVVQSTAISFQTVINLGLPLSMMRNASDVLERAQALDRNIQAIHVFNQTGIVVHTTSGSKPTPIDNKILNIQKYSNTPRWSFETDGELYSGVSVFDNKQTLIGGVLAIYPKDEYKQSVQKIIRRIAVATIILLVTFSLLSLLILRVRLSGAIKGTQFLEEWFWNVKNKGSSDLGEHAENTLDLEGRDHGFLKDAMRSLNVKLTSADKNYKEIFNQIDTSGTGNKGVYNDVSNEVNSNTKLKKVMASMPETSVAKAFSKQLVPWTIGIVLMAVISLGAVTFDSIRNSFDPELERRTDLIAHVANANLQRAVSAGVPLERIIGLDGYFSELLKDFPEVSFFGVATGKFIFQAGSWQRSSGSDLTGKKDVPVYPITYEGENTGYIIIDPSSDYIALQFRAVVLDLAVVIIVALLLANEIMVIVISVSLTAPLNRLQYLARLQANGDFSSRIRSRGTNAVEQLISFLSDRSETLQNKFEELQGTIREKYTEATFAPKKILQFSYMNDIRLPLFLFAAADELPTSFFPIFTRDAENSIGWLDPAIVISLPLAGYLFAYMLASPFSRSLSERLGHRKLLLIALLPVFVSNAGMYFVSDVVEIIALRTIAGAGYAFAVLACQDYVIDVVPKEQRTKSIGVFSATLFGGIFAGIALGGVLADRFGVPSAFLVSALFVMVSALIFFFIIPSGRRPAVNVELPLTLKSLVAPLKNTYFFILVFGVAIPQSVMDQVFVSYLFSLQLDALSASAADIGRMLMVYFLMIMLSVPLLGCLSSLKIGNSFIIIVGSLFTGGGLMVATIVPTQWAMLVAAAGAGFGHGLTRGPVVEIALHLSETQLSHLGSNSVLGALRFLERAGSIIGLLVLAAITGYMGIASAIGAIGILIVGGVLLYAFQVLSTRANKHLKGIE